VPRFTLKQLEYFVAVAETGSVTGAAATIPLSQSALSTALADLERVLGVQLLLRHHARGVTLTPAGERLVLIARALLGQAEDLQTTAGEIGGAALGNVTLGCFSVLAPYVLPQIHAAAAEQLPGLQVDVVEGSLDELESGVLSGKLELALGYDLGFGPGLLRQSLFQVPAYLLLPAGHRLAGRRRLTLQALAGEPMVLLDLPHSRDYFLAAFERAGVEPVVRYRTRSVELARALVGRGLAYTVLNLRPAGDTSLDGLPVRPVPLMDPPPALEAVLLQAEGVRATRRAEAVAALCRSVLTTKSVGQIQPRD
jgi:DNA-binding transcriptional LysR family regulator